MTRSRGLHDRADDGDDGCEDQVVATTDFVGDDASAESTNETTALQGSDDVGLKIGSRYTLQFGEAVSADDCVSTVQKRVSTLCKILLLEGVHGQDTADDTGIHTEKHTTEASLSLSANICVTMSRGQHSPSLPERTRAIRRSLGDPA